VGGPLSWEDGGKTELFCMVVGLRLVRDGRVAVFALIDTAMITRSGRGKETWQTSATRPDGMPTARPRLAPNLYEREWLQA
jgi:hypothetical protein